MFIYSEYLIRECTQKLRSRDSALILENSARNDTRSGEEIDTIQRSAQLLLK